jgi:hypothetical protein
LGLDVHDTNTIGPYRTLEPGVLLAIEPGLYIPDHPQFGPYAGIGVRIEDDVLITQTGCEVGPGTCLVAVGCVDRWQPSIPWTSSTCPKVDFLVFDCIAS